MNSIAGAPAIYTFLYCGKEKQTSIGPNNSLQSQKGSMKLAWLSILVGFLPRPFVFVWWTIPLEITRGTISILLISQIRMRPGPRQQSSEEPKAARSRKNSLTQDGFRVLSNSIDRSHLTFPSVEPLESSC